MENFRAEFRELETIFEPQFEEFISLYYGVDSVWIGDGTTGDDGVLYAKYADGVIQRLGPVSGYYYAKQAGFTGTYAEYVQVILDSLQHALDSEAYAIGARNGTAVPSTDPTYHNNSKYYSEQANTYKTAAETAKNAAQTAQGLAETAQTGAERAQSAAETAQTGAEAAETNSDARAEDSEAWAVGKRKNVDVPSTDETYHNNSKYYSEQSATSASSSAVSATNAATSESNASTSETNAAASAADAALSASNSASSASNAAASALNASASAINAASSESNAAQSEASAAQHETDAKTAKTAAESAQQKAEEAVGHYPRIKSNDNWEVWNGETEQWQDTGHKSIAEATTSYGYQNSRSGTTVPTGTWENNPQPQSGMYLWTRITYTWTNGSVDNFYNVSYIGANGSGAVNSVNGLAGDVVLDGKNVYIDDDAQTKETIYQGFARIGNAITNSEIDVLFDVD